jgi:hypothetical protein
MLAASDVTMAAGEEKQEDSLIFVIATHLLPGGPGNILFHREQSGAGGRRI